MNDTNKEEHAKIVERVRRLFAMSQDDSSPHEASIAMRRCTSLMSQHGIKKEDLETSELGSHPINRKPGSMPAHIQTMGYAVGKMYDCLYVWGGSTGQGRFSGYKVDAEVAALTLDYVLAACERSLAARKKEGFPAGKSASHDYRRSFAHEILIKCGEICRARVLQEEEVAGTGTSLIVRKMKEVEERMGKGLKITRVAHPSRASSYAASTAGAEDGKKTSLNEQVSRADQRQLT